MRIDRHQFGARAFGAVGGVAALAARDAAAADETPVNPDGVGDTSVRGRGNRIAVSTYSFWRFRDNSKLSIDECIDEAARIGFDGVEILHMQMESEEPGYLQRLKRRAFLNGLDLFN